MKSIVFHKTNWIHICTILAVAGVIALVLQSWITFFLTAGVLYFLCVRNPKIRLQSKRNW